MAYARRYAPDNHLPDLKLNFFEIDSKDGTVADLVRDVIISYMQKNYPKISTRTKDVTVKMPWIIMF